MPPSETSVESAVTGLLSCYNVITTASHHHNHNGEPEERQGNDHNETTEQRRCEQCRRTRDASEFNDPMPSWVPAGFASNDTDAHQPATICHDCEEQNVASAHAAAMRRYR